MVRATSSVDGVTTRFLRLDRYTPAAPAGIFHKLLGLGSADLVCWFDADASFPDGAVTEASPWAAEAIREEFPDQGKFRNFWNLVLRPCSLAGQASMVGAASLPFMGLFAAGEPVPASDRPGPELRSRCASLLNSTQDLPRARSSGG